MYNIVRDTSPVSKRKISKLDKFLSVDDYFGLQPSKFKSTMLLANKGAVMTVLDKLNLLLLIHFKTTTLSPFVVANLL